MCLKYLFNVTP